jgi:hypothetical protein
MKNLVGVGDVNTANRLAQWTYYAEPSSPTRQSDVEKVLERAQELSRRWPEKISGRLVPVLYTLGSRNPDSTKGKGAQDMAHREQKRNRKEEVLGAGGADA